MLRDLSDAWSWIKKLNDKVSRIYSGAFLENSSITNGRMRFIGGLLRIDSGGRVEIVGTLQIDGSTTATGTFRLEGNWTFTGDGTITGKLTQTGPWELNGAGQIKGNVDVTGTIRVLAGGKIQVGNIIIDPTISGGAVTFANGAQVFTDGTTIQVYKGNGVVQISDTEAKLQLGGTAIRVTSGNVQILGLPTRSRANAQNAVIGSVWSDTSGNFFRVVN